MCGYGEVDAIPLKCSCPATSEGVLKIKDCCECEMNVCAVADASAACLAQR